MTIKELKDMIRILEEKNISDETRIYIWDDYKEESYPIKDWDLSDKDEFVYLVI